MKALIDYDEFRRLIAATKDFVAKNSTKPVYDFIKFEFFADTTEVRACACDGHKLSIEWGCCCDVDVDFTALISPVLVAKIDRCEHVEIHANDNNVTVDGEYSCISYPVPDYKDFVNVDAAIPAGDPLFGIGFNPRFLRDALNASAKANGNVNRPIIIDVYDPLKPAVMRSQTSKRGDNIRMVMPVRYKQR